MSRAPCMIQGRGSVYSREPLPWFMLRLSLLYIASSSNGKVNFAVIIMVRKRQTQIPSGEGSSKPQDSGAGAGAGEGAPQRPPQQPQGRGTPQVYPPQQVPRGGGGSVPQEQVPGGRDFAPHKERWIRRGRFGGVTT